MKLFLDIYRLIEQAEPDWFVERRNEVSAPESQNHLLLVEDIPFLRQLVEGYLEAGGYEVTTAENGWTALERIKDTEIDLIVSDINMSVMDGYDFIKRVRAGNYRPNTPALALSALDSEKDIDKAMESGFDDYELKIDREKLLRRVAGMLKNN